MTLVLHIICTDYICLFLYCMFVICVCCSQKCRVQLSLTQVQFPYRLGCLWHLRSWDRSSSQTGTASFILQYLKSFPRDLIWRSTHFCLRVSDSVDEWLSKGGDDILDPSPWEVSLCLSVFSFHRQHDGNMTTFDVK